MSFHFSRGFVFSLIILFSAFGARAEIGSIDAVPAATLLLPYFEVGLENSGNTHTTLFSINNAKPESVIVHITLWTTLGRPSIDFDIFLTGYDVHTINLADLFRRGTLPASPVLPPGEFSVENVVPSGCDFPLPTTLPAAFFSYLRNLHTGLPAPTGFPNSGLCAAPTQGNGDAGNFVAQGYITMDVVNDCSLTFPSDEGYFGDGGSGVASNNNAIWGDFFLVDPATEFAHGDNLVHIEAIGSVGEGFWDSGDYTFYGRYNGFDGTDNREALATTWASRYFSGSAGPFSAESSFYVWRDSGLNDSEFFECGTIPAPYPLEQAATFVWDEEENGFVTDRLATSPFPTPPDLGPPPFPAAATRAPVTDLRSIFSAGWVRLDFRLETGSVLDPIKQAYVSVMHSASGQFSVGFRAVNLDNALDKTFTVTTETDDSLPSQPIASSSTHLSF